MRFSRDLHASAFHDLQCLEAHAADIPRLYAASIVLPLLELYAHSPFNPLPLPLLIPKIMGQSSIMSALEARNFNAYCLPTGILMQNRLRRTLAPFSPPRDATYYSFSLFFFFLNPKDIRLQCPPAYYHSTHETEGRGWSDRAKRWGKYSRCAEINGLDSHSLFSNA